MVIYIPCAWPSGLRWRRTDARSTVSHPSCSTLTNRAFRICYPNRDTLCRTSPSPAPLSWPRFVPKRHGYSFTFQLIITRCFYSQQTPHEPPTYRRRHTEDQLAAESAESRRRVRAAAGRRGPATRKGSCAGRLSAGDPAALPWLRSSAYRLRHRQSGGRKISELRRKYKDNKIYQKGRIRSGDRSVGFDERGLQLGQLFRSGDTNSVVAVDHLVDTIDWIL